MDDPADARFFEALRLTCQNLDNVDQPCHEAIERAAETGDPIDRQNAHRVLNELDESTRDKLLRSVHLYMATDLSAISDMIHGAPPKSRPN